MTCATCGKHVSPLSAVTEGGATFCSRACLDDWRTKHGPAPAGGRPKVPDEAAAAPLEFPMDPPGFERRGMRLRLSYWTAPKLFLDGKLLAPVNGGIFARARHYRVLNNAGKETDVAMRRRPLDQIPEITIDGVVYPVVRPLNAWEYVWMGLPALLLVVGGALGGAIGLSAVFVNSILMRRMRNRVARYLFTGVTTALAAMMFVQSSTFVRPLLESFGLGGGTIEGRIREAAAEVNRNCPERISCNPCGKTTRRSVSGGGLVSLA